MVKSAAHIAFPQTAVCGYCTLTLKGGEQQQNSEDEGSGGGGDKVGAEKVRRSGRDDASRIGAAGTITRQKAVAGDEARTAAKSGDNEPLVSSLELGTGDEQGPTATTASDAFVGRAKKREGLGDAKGGDKGEQQGTKPRKGRLVPGSLVLSSLSASDLPNTEKGVFSKQV